jgi:hypothetical protein
MSSHGARCEHAGGALCEPRGLSLPDGPTTAIATSPCPTHAETHSPAY